MKILWTNAFYHLYLSLGFTVYQRSAGLLACIVVIPFISLENTDIIFASVDEPIVDNTWTTFYNQACSITRVPMNIVSLVYKLYLWSLYSDTFTVLVY
jgi:hypothetical protein